MLKTSACSELPLRFLGSSFLGASSTRESTLESVFSVAAAIVEGCKQQWGSWRWLKELEARDDERAVVSFG
jgi:hypothetical protein